MRIIAGRFKGLPLTTPKSTTRPTTDRTKEAIFSRLDSWGVLDDARVLDLFAGTGALGFEALSRGARELVLVEANAAAAQLVAKTATLIRRQRGWEPDMEVHVVKAKAEQYVQRMAGRTESFDVVLIDPPYAFPTDDCNALLAGLVDGGLAGEDAVIMLERSTRTEPPTPPAGWTETDRRDYGETAVYYYEAA
ncbi:16S rRNA (guanine(966)-N(2))-methyltransferase RsmD [Bifidobacterium choloepi]|uniref:16S rRNA (Guanine(966)-N(2))-methyltransferase RsmD n=1 Tax=Bifidobacterium choloepi TaxID=2614131 RepID=A0A6I5N2C0_9BIFI|nr:16S rRNA (guanine(966)-N(2))-methyltransferase RsmD [Bifidobacterium choloepi]NEG69789.1 16S rRNA (guanine(966)-N(2))-methyltransferase RsmD [Bifidobacterium choloepi]